MVELFGTIPGIQIEATGGEVQYVTRVRGITTDRGYLIFQQDGLPIYHEIDGVSFNSGEGMHRFDLMTKRVEVVRGGPRPRFMPAARRRSPTNITATSGAVPRGRAQVTIGDTGLYRLDATRTARRTHLFRGRWLPAAPRGYRKGGFPSDKGGQIRANLRRDLDNGFVKVCFEWVGRRYVDLFNLTNMPGYETLAAGASITWRDWRIQVVGDNLTNAKGLTEGNPRTDQLAGQGATEAIYGRPLFGRNFPNIEQVLVIAMRLPLTLAALLAVLPHAAEAASVRDAKMVALATRLFPTVPFSALRALAYVCLG